MSGLSRGDNSSGRVIAADSHEVVQNKLAKLISQPFAGFIFLLVVPHLIDGSHDRKGLTVQRNLVKKSKAAARFIELAHQIESFSITPGRVRLFLPALEGHALGQRSI